VGKAEYIASIQLARSAHLELSANPFYALLMAAMREADSTNLERLKLAFPGTWAELQAHYHAPGGLLEGEE